MIQLVKCYATLGKLIILQILVKYYTTTININGFIDVSTKLF
jgi:hypothetical protein